MILKTLQWNIGGGKIRSQNADPALQESYQDDGIDHILDVLVRFSADVLTFQETHASQNFIQAEYIAKKLNLPYWMNNTWGDSHLEKNQKLGQAIISRYPLIGQQFKWLDNPKWVSLTAEGKQKVSFDKGVSEAKLVFDQKEVLIQVLHLVPFHKYGINPLSEQAATVRQNVVETLLNQNDHFILQGDFNIDQRSLKQFLPEVFVQGAKEVITEATTPKNKWLDHIIYKGFSCNQTVVDSTVLTDHFPIYTEFEVL